MAEGMSYLGGMGMNNPLENLIRDLIGELSFGVMSRSTKDYYIHRLREEIRIDKKADEEMVQLALELEEVL
jgi:hypothetical protein